MTKEVMILIKVFDSERHADAFFSKGEMYCRKVGYFKRIEGDAARGDKFEGVAGWYQPDLISAEIKIRTPNGEVESHQLDLAAPLIMQHAAVDRFNAYCMYSITRPNFNETYRTEDERLRAVDKINSILNEHAKLGEKMLSLGEYAVVVFNVEKFIEKVAATAIREGFKCYRSLVDYFEPDTFHGSFGEIESIFKKRDMYSYQKEFRFAFDSVELEGEKTLYVGSLDGIAFRIPTREIDKRMKLEVYNGPHVGADLPS